MPTPIRNLVRLVTILVLIVLASRILARPAPAHPWMAQFENRPRPLVIAHADDGGTSPWPGDTLLFLENAAALQVDVLEMNVNMSKDGEIVLIHDNTVDDTTEGTGRISDMNLSQIQALDAAFDWTRDDGLSFPYRGAGIQIPTLASVFETFPDYPMVVEIKQTEPSMTTNLCELIREYNKATQVLVASFSDSTISEFRSDCPEIATAAASDETRQFVYLNFAFLANPAVPKFQAFQVPIESSGITVVRSAFVNAAQRQNIEVHPWTINDPDEMDYLIDLGVDAIMTDRIDVLIEKLGR